MCVGEQVLKVHSHAHLGLEEVGGTYVLLQYGRYPLMSEFLSGRGRSVGGEGEERDQYTKALQMCTCEVQCIHTGVISISVSVMVRCYVAVRSLSACFNLHTGHLPSILLPYHTATHMCHIQTTPLTPHHTLQTFECPQCSHVRGRGQRQ